MSVKKQNSVLPTVSQLKAEVQAKRAELKASGKTDKNSVAMKEIARKYGFTCWEKLHAASVKQAEGKSNGTTVIVLIVDGGDAALIANRKIIITNDETEELESVIMAGKALANALAVEYKEVSIRCADIRINGEMLTVDDLHFHAIGGALDLVDPLNESDLEKTGTVSEINSDALEDFGWTVEDEKAAFAEGWSIFHNGAPNCKYRIETIDDPDAWESMGNIKPAPLDDDADAWHIVWHGKQPHHQKARDIIQSTSPKEWNDMSKHLA